MFDAMGAAGSADDINAMEIHHWYTKFMKECPSGQLCLHEFKHVLGLHELTAEANSYVEQVFHTFDMNKGLNAKPSKQSTATPFHSLGSIQSHLSQHIFSAKHCKFSKSIKAHIVQEDLAQREHKFHVLSSREPLQKQVEPWEHIEVLR
ncbi:hypothetical protein QYF61_016767 [Mycteria americana]|uniref:Uncharacterized protein n=1 Tax=Mycteria americana TaxID=33587 RepID=A0AAN7NTC0_MYCAM|nr:hypothetical protein QYF61_016767 [Mycteria americana]